MSKERHKRSPANLDADRLVNLVFRFFPGSNEDCQKQLAFSKISELLAEGVTDTAEIYRKISACNGTPSTHVSAHQGSGEINDRSFFNNKHTRKHRIPSHCFIKRYN